MLDLINQLQEKQDNLKNLQKEIKSLKEKIISSYDLKNGDRVQIGSDKNLTGYINFIMVDDNSNVVAKLFQAKKDGSVSKNLHSILTLPSNIRDFNDFVSCSHLTKLDNIVIKEKQKRTIKQNPKLYSANIYGSSKIVCAFSKKQIGEKYSMSSSCLNDFCNLIGPLENNNHKIDIDLTKED